MNIDYQNRNPDFAIREDLPRTSAGRHRPGSHRGFSSTPSTPRSPSKFAIFIRDTPNFEQEPLLRCLLTKLHDRNVFPTYCYSVVELLKITGNVTKMRDYGAKLLPRYSANAAVAYGCSLMMKDLIDYAMKSEPQLLVVDYLSETLVEVRRILETVTQRHFKVYFLKRKPGSGVSSDDLVMPIVEEICPFILNQDLDKIRVDQEMDKWWNESIGIVVNHTPPVKYSHLKNSSAKKQTNCPDKRWRIRRKIETLAGDFDITTPKSKEVNIESALCFREQTDLYLKKIGDILLYCDFGHEYKQFMKEIRKDERYYRKWANEDRTLVVITPKQLKVKENGRRRLVDTFVEKLVETGVTVHTIPIAEMLINPKCSELMAEYRAKLGWGIMETFKTIVPDVFYQCYDQEDVVVLDCARESLVGSKEYIKDALKRNWKVYSMNQIPSFEEEHKINDLVAILRKRHQTGGESLTSDKRFSSIFPEKIDFV